MARQTTRRIVAIRHRHHRRTLQLQIPPSQTLQSTEETSTPNQPDIRTHRHPSPQQPSRHLPFRLIDQGARLYPTITSYRDRYFTPGRRNGHIVYDWKLKPGSEQAIHNAIDDITLSMKAIDHLDMPKTTTVDRTVHLNKKAATTYQRLRDDMVADISGEVVDAGSAGVLAGKLQQLAAGAIYTDHNFTEIHDAKLDALDEIIEEANGQTVLIAFWFKHDLARLKARYPASRLGHRCGHGGVEKGELPIAFIHPASAGHGLNLQSGGHILVWFTPIWSLELYEQTNGRLNRQGQQHPVTIIRVIAAGTIDTHIVKALEKKNTTQQALISAVSAVLKGKNYGIDSKAAVSGGAPRNFVRKRHA